MLDLRHDFVSSQGNTSMSLHVSDMSEVEFAAPESDRFIGNLGAAVGRNHDYYGHDDYRGAKRSKPIEKTIMYEEA
jgi:hypothetical protein